MADKVITSTGDCTFCCSPPAGCSCALLIPPFDAAYSDYSTAATAITDQTSNCIGYYHANHLGSFIAGFDGTLFNVSGNDVGGGLNQVVTIYASFSLLASQVVSAAYTVTTGDPINSVIFSLLDCATGADVDTSTDSSSSGTLTVTAPADGEYIIYLSGTSAPGTFGAFALDGIISNSGGAGTWWVNPVIALWDDSGTTRSLWACPKLLLPPLTESTGDWYASCADAAAVLTDAARVSNCIGYSGGAPGATSFTATDGGTSLTLAVGSASGASTWGGLNLVAGATITVACTPGGADLTVKIYDDTGVLVEDSGLTTTPFVSAALPYTGRYTINVIVSGVGPVSTSATITSSGTLSVNPVQARYDLGLVCAGTLNCGDACP